MRINLSIRHKQTILIGIFFLITFALTFWYSLLAVNGILYSERENTYRDRIANLITILENGNSSCSARMTCNRQTWK
jgi:hypothetical protein